MFYHTSVRAVAPIHLVQIFSMVSRISHFDFKLNADCQSFYLIGSYLIHLKKNDLAKLSRGNMKTNLLSHIYITDELSLVLKGKEHLG